MRRVTAVRFVTASLPLAMILLCVPVYQSVPIGAAVVAGEVQPRAAVSSEMRFTYMARSNFLIEVGDIRILLDGYITRLPESVFVGGSEGDSVSRQARRSRTWRRFNS